MKLFAKLLCAAALTLFLCLAASAREVVIYENGFDDASALSDFTVRGSWSVKNGAADLAAGKSCRSTAVRSTNWKWIFSGRAAWAGC